MTTALIGYTGFVGTTLRRQRAFDELYRSTNIAEIGGRTFSEVICAGAPGQKWRANRDPKSDTASIQKLIDHLRTIRADRFILISTVDIFHRPVDVDESSDPGDHEEAYGRNRRLLESAVQEKFSEAWVVRLPALVGPGLRKNVIFDLLNDHNMSSIDSRGTFQYYPMVNLNADIVTMQKQDLRLLHLTSEPITVADVAKEGFGRLFKNHVLTSPPTYRFQSLYGTAFGGSERYQYSRKEVLLAIRAYAQSEERTAKLK